MAGYTETEKSLTFAERTETLRLWSDSLTVDETAIRNIIVNIFEMPGDIPPIGAINTENAIEGCHNQIYTYQDSVLTAYGSLEAAESIAVQKHLEILAELEDAFGKARVKHEGFAAAISRATSGIVDISVNSASWVIALPGEAFNSVAESATGAAMNAYAAAGDLVGGAKSFIEDVAVKPAVSIGKYLAVALGGVAVIALIGVAAWGGAFRRV